MTYRTSGRVAKKGVGTATPKFEVTQNASGKVRGELVSVYIGSEERMKDDNDEDAVAVLSLFAESLPRRILKSGEWSEVQRYTRRIDIYARTRTFQS